MEMMRVFLVFCLTTSLLGEVPKDAFYDKIQKQYIFTDNTDGSKLIRKVYYDTGELKEDMIKFENSGKSITKYYTREGYLEALVEVDSDGKVTVKNFYDNIPQKKPWTDRKKINNTETMVILYSSDGKIRRKDISNSKTLEKRVIIFNEELSHESEVVFDGVIKNFIYQKVYINKKQINLEKVNESIMFGKLADGRPTKKQWELYLKKGIEYFPQPPIP
jgi:hypothetical protein